MLPPNFTNSVISLLCEHLTLRSVDWYDAKLWQFVLKHGQEGDFIWNLAALPDDVETAAREALAVMEQGPP